MKARLVGTVTLLAALLLACSTVCAAEAAEGSFDGTLKVSGPVELEVATGSGSIVVRAGGSGAVEVHGKIRASSGWRVTSREAEEKVRYLESHPPIVQDGNNIRIGHIEDEELRRNISISYEIVTPADTRLHAHSGSGSVRAANLSREAEVSTGSGSIELDGIGGSVRASTGSGSIRAGRVAGGFTGRTGSGNVEVDHTAAGNDEIDTGSGSVEVRRLRGSLRVRTGSGGIRAQGEPVGDWRMHTGSGAITVHLPPQAAFELQARTSSGHVRTTHEITVQGILSPRELHGKARGGGPLIEATTSSGSVDID